MQLAMPDSLLVNTGEHYSRTHSRILCALSVDSVNHACRPVDRLYNLVSLVLNYQLTQADPLFVSSHKSVVEYQHT